MSGLVVAIHFLVIIICGALVVAAPFLLIQWLYPMTVRRWMRKRGGAVQEETHVGPAAAGPSAGAQLLFEIIDSHSPAHPSPADESLHRRVLRASRATASAYTAAGVAYAAAMTILLVGFDRSVSNKPAAFIICFASLLWLPLLIYVTVAAEDRWRKLVLLAAYYVGLIGVRTIVGTRNISLGEFFAVELMPLSASVLIIMRRTGVAGVAVCFVSCLVFAGHNLALPFFERAVLKQSYIEYISFPTLIVIAIVLSALLLIIPAALYARKKMSDMTLLLDSFILFMTIWGVTQVLTRIWAGWYIVTLLVVPFVLYKFAMLFATRWINPRGREGVSLMLLRVFSPKWGDQWWKEGPKWDGAWLLDPKWESEWLQRQVSYHWRHEGSIQLIAAPDLTGANVELPELLNFITGRLKKQFIKNPADRRRQLDVLDLAPDPDGLYRVNEFFCLEDMWRGTVAELLRRSQVVLMDLRGFSQSNQGCIEELREVINLVPVNRLVLTADKKTDVGFLELTLGLAWMQLRLDSPNNGLRDTKVRILHITRQDSRAARRLLSMLAEAALPGSPNRQAL